jgi:O-succinylbenzoate synthase
MIEYHRYTLRSRDEGGLNARSTRRELEGALIRVDGVGVGCIHPWPELGDPNLDQQFGAMELGRPHPLAVCALECAAIDGDARRAGRWLFEDLVIPGSHWTAGPSDDPEAVAADGFDTAKLKLGPEIELELGKVENWGSAEGIERLRLDFNESLNADAFVEFWRGLSAAVRAKIDFVEDPFLYDFDQWTEIESKTGAVLALDRQVAEFGDEWPGVVVVKPATVEQSEIGILDAAKLRRLVFTSYMDHAIGQCWATYVAAIHQAGANVAAGLLTHERFETDEFFNRIQRVGNVLRPPRGTGLGFDEQLEALPWKPLN